MSLDLTREQFLTLVERLARGEDVFGAEEDEDDEEFSERPEPDYEAWVEERAMREWDDRDRGDW